MGQRQNNYQIIGVLEGASLTDIRDSFRKLVLKYHHDKGGDDAKFKKIKQAYEDLKLGKKYPDTEEERKKKSKVYSGDFEQEQRRKNLILTNDIARQMKTAVEWVAALNRTDTTGVRLFGSKELGEIEIERKATKAISIKGKYWAGNFSYDNSIIMWGSITSPYFTEHEKLKTRIHIKKGKFSLIDPIQNKYEIDGGSKIIVDDGDIIVGNISGIKEMVPDPEGRVGMYLTKEHFTELIATKGKIVAGNVRETAKLEANEITVLNLVDNVKVRGKKISILGTKVNYDVEFELLEGGSIRFYDQGSGYDISDDAIIKLENGKETKLFYLKISKMISYGGKEITYDYIDKMHERGSKKPGDGWGKKFGSIFGKK